MTVVSFIFLLHFILSMRTFLASSPQTFISSQAADYKNFIVAYSSSIFLNLWFCCKISSSIFSRVCSVCVNENFFQICSYLVTLQHHGFSH